MRHSSDTPMCGSTNVTIAHDHAGNLIDDGSLVYIYDAWHRLVFVRASNDSDVTIQAAEFDGRGRRIKKVVTNAGDYDGTVVYFYDGQKIIETRNGSAVLMQQFVRGTQYISSGLWPDEIIMVRMKDHGELFVHQDANWNVISVTDLAGHEIERYTYTPYGELTVHQLSGYGDYDGDGDADSDDQDFIMGDCYEATTGPCMVLDLDSWGTVNILDLAAHIQLQIKGYERDPGATATGVFQLFAHQGLLFDPEINSYQNRARQYDPGKRRFMQRDPLAFRFGGFAAPLHYRHDLNLFGYQMGNPVLWSDPRGEGPEDWPAWWGRLGSELPDALLRALTTGNLLDHGNYCGPNNTCVPPHALYPWYCAVSEVPPLTGGFCNDKPRRDALDLCCAKHDACYYGTPPGYVGWFEPGLFTELVFLSIPGPFRCVEQG